MVFVGWTKEASFHFLKRGRLGALGTEQASGMGSSRGGMCVGEEVWYAKMHVGFHGVNEGCGWRRCCISLGGGVGSGARDFCGDGGGGMVVQKKNFPHSNTKKIHCGQCVAVGQNRTRYGTYPKMGLEGRGFDPSTTPGFGRTFFDPQKFYWRFVSAKE